MTAPDKTCAECIRVLIVDDHAMVREGLTSFLKAFRDLELVGAVANGSEALRLCRKQTVDVVLVDLVMPEMDGIEVTRAVRQQSPQTQVIALTSFDDDNRVRQVLEAGAIGFLFKTVGARELAQAIRAAKAGKPTLAPEAARAVLDMMHPSTSTPGLTGREQEVLALLAKGWTNPQIASQLKISPFTVKNHISHILEKLGASSRTEAAALAFQRQLIKLE